MKHKRTKPLVLLLKIGIGYFILAIVISCMAAILIHERERVREIDAVTDDIRTFKRHINMAHNNITRLSILGEGVISWKNTDYHYYHAQRLRTDSLLQALKPHCREYVRPAQIDTLRTLLAEKEAHLLHLTEILARQDVADSLLINHLPEIAKRATRIPLTAISGNAELLLNDTYLMKIPHKPVSLQGILNLQL